LKNSVSHTQHIRRQKGIPKINSHPKSQGFFPHRPETLQKRILQMHNYRRIIINLQKNHGRQAIDAVPPKRQKGPGRTAQKETTANSKPD
jgi:hypothetical protein